MFGTRDLFSKIQQINEAAESFFKEDVERVADFLAKTTSPTSESSPEEDELRQSQLRVQAKEIVEDVRKHSEIYYLQRLLQQGKQISQIIAYIWRWIDDEGNPEQQKIAEQLKEYFLRPSDGNLKNLLTANPKEDNPTTNPVQANFLRKIFSEYNSNNKLIFPIFDNSELGEGGYLIEVTFNGFNGMLEDGDRNNPNTIKFVIPYPPKPQFGKGTITPSDLEDWIADTDNKKYVADNPYIPTTCS